MALLYISVGIFLGGVSAILVMAMFFVAKKADEAEDELVTTIGSVTSRKDPF